MFKRMCMNCGKQMLFKEGEKIRQFCCKQCSDVFKEKEYNHPSTGPVMPHLKAENITDEGYIALVKAVVARASHDVTHFKPGTLVRIQAEKFFESEYFSALTGLDGQAILRDLRNQGKKKETDKRGKRFRKRAVQCIETGVVYDSIKEAAMAYNVNPSSISDVLTKKQNRAAKMHWRYVEKGAVV